MLALGFWLDEAKTRRRYVAVAALSALGAVAQLVLLTARWPMVIRTMGYKSYEPELGFIWLIDQSPILGSARVLGQGQIDNWLWILAKGWTGREAQPAAAVAILGAWAVCFALALRGLRNAVRASGGAGLSPRDPLVSP